MPSTSFTPVSRSSLLLHKGLLLEWQGPSLSKTILPSVHPTTANSTRRPYPEILKFPQNPAHGSPRSSWSLELVEPVRSDRDHPTAQLWRCKAKCASLKKEFPVILKIYVELMAEKNGYSRARSSVSYDGREKVSHKMTWKEGRELVEREMMPYQLMNDLQGTVLAYNLGLYSFQLGANVQGGKIEVCEGFVLEDLTQTTISVESWFNQRKKLDLDDFETLMSSLFETQDRFIDRNVSLLHNDCHDLLLTTSGTDKKKLQAVAVGFGRAQTHKEVEKALVETNKGRPTKQEWWESAKHTLLLLLAHRLGETNGHLYEKSAAIQARKEGN